MEVRIEGSFESLSQDEWDKYLSVEFFEDMFIKEGALGESVQYFPEFKEEHWMRKYWFNYFADTFYLKMSAVGDSIIEIINEKYQFGFRQDLRFRARGYSRGNDESDEHSTDMYDFYTPCNAHCHMIFPK